GEDHNDCEHTEPDTESELAHPLLLRMHHGVGMLRRLQADVAECRLRPQREDRETDDHADTGRTEAPVPADLLTQEPRDELAEEGTDVDAHVEDREARVAALAAFRIQVPDNRRDVRLEQTRAEDDQDQAQEERDLPGEEGRRADRYVPQRDQQRTPPDRAPQTEQPVGYPAARERGQVNAEPV